jgi:hypothetical protein
MVALHERYHHRKPVTAKTLRLGDELLACVLEGVYGVEKTMIELQHTAIVKQTRSAFQSATRHKFIGAIERLSGREELTFISNHHVGPDIENQTIHAQPAADPGTERRLTPLGRARPYLPGDDQSDWGYVESGAR